MRYSAYTPGNRSRSWKPRVRRKRSGVSVLLSLTLIFISVVVGTNTARRIIYPQKYSTLVGQYSSQFGVDESLVYAVIKTESGFDKSARSAVGAMGLMQITPETFEWLQTKLPPEHELTSDDLYQPEINIRYGVFFLSLLRGEFGNDRLAIAAYHAGRGSVNNWLSSNIVTSDGCEISDIPISATGHYVSKVESARDVYIDMYYR